MLIQVSLSLLWRCIRKFLNQTLIFDLYADYMQNSQRTAVLGQQARNMFKGFVAYTTPKITFGLEAFTQQIKNGIDQYGHQNNEDATVQAFSVYARGAIVKDQLGFLHGMTAITR